MSRRFRKWIVLLLALGLVSAACTSEEADVSTTSGDAPETTADAGDTTDTTEAPETTEATDSGEGETPILQVPFRNDPVGFNPFPETAGIGPIFVLFPNLLEPDENNEITSQIMESWEISEDAQTVTLTLKPDLEWSDGEPLDSADLLMSLQLQLDPNISNRAARIGGVVGTAAFADGTADNISGLSAPDDRTVTIELEEPNVAWIPNLASLMRLVPILPEHYLGDVPHSEIPGHSFFEELPVAAGPFKFVEYVPGQHVEMEKNENWSVGEAGFDRVFFRIIDGGSDVLAAQLEAGDIHFMTGLPALDAERIEAVEGLTVQSATGQAADMFQLSWDDPLLDDPRIRQAMIHAIDRVGICEEALLGFCSVPTTNMRPVGEAVAWSVPTDDVIEYDYDPDRARELLAEAGWDETNQLVFLHRPGIGHQDLAVTIAQANWADVGINVEVVNVDVSTLLDALDDEVDREGAQAWMNAGANFTMDPSAVQPYASCDTRYPDGPNLSWYCNPDVDELWAQGRQETDQAARAEIYKEAFRILNADPNEIYVFVVDNIVAYDERLTGIEPQGDTYNQYWNIGEWRWEG